LLNVDFDEKDEDEETTREGKRGRVSLQVEFTPSSMRIRKKPLVNKKRPTS
jgi:hypothetical protein